MQLCTTTSHNESHHTGLGELSCLDTKSAIRIKIKLPWANPKTTRFEILKEVNVLLAHDTVISGRRHCSRQTCCLHLHIKRGITLKTEALRSSATSEPMSLTRLLHIPLECTLYYFISVVSNLDTVKHKFSKQLYSSTCLLPFILEQSGCCKNIKCALCL